MMLVNQRYDMFQQTVRMHEVAGRVMVCFVTGNTQTC